MDTTGASGRTPARGTRSTLRDLAHLYEAADDLADRCRSGEATQVLLDVVGPLAEAEAAGVPEVVDRLSYVVALANLLVGHLDEVDRTCERVLARTPEPADPAWMSVAHTLRGLASQARGNYSAAVDDLADAAVLLDDARPYGQPFITASHVLGAGYTGLRLYELALEAIQRATQLVIRPGFGISRIAHVLTTMTLELCWGLELDRLNQTQDAHSHFSSALAVAAEVETMAAARGGVWTLRLRSRTGLCRAMLGQADAATTELESTIEAITAGGLGERPLVRIGMGDEAVARIGLVRAYAGLGDLERAASAAQQAQLAAGRTADPKLVLAAAWEQLRLTNGGPPSAARAVVAKYADQLEEERWKERVRFTRETRERLQAERERIRARRMSAEYLTDSVTGVPNRRHLELRLPEFMDRATSHQESVALAFVDLDAEASTHTLVAVGSMLRERAAPDGFVARYGGGEFVVVLPRHTAKELAHLVAGVLEDRPNGDDEPRPRVGIAATQGSTSLAGLVAAADEALLAARRSGGGIRLGAASAS